MADMSEVRALMIQLYGLTKADAAHTLYYDETNNARRLHVTLLVRSAFGASSTPRSWC